MGKYLDAIKEKQRQAANSKYEKMYSGELTLVLSRLLKNKDFRFYLSDLIGYTNPFQTSFDEKGNVSSFNAGKQSVGLRIFNDIMAIDPDAFVQLMKEEAFRKQAKDKLLQEMTDGSEQ